MLFDKICCSICGLMLPRKSNISKMPRIFEMQFFFFKKIANIIESKLVQDAQAA